MASSDCEIRHEINKMGPVTEDVPNSSSDMAQGREVKIAPLTLGLCLGVFLLSVDRTIVAVVSRCPSPLPILVPDQL
jgi:hypothetical protein